MREPDRHQRLISSVSSERDPCVARASSLFQPACRYCGNHYYADSIDGECSACGAYGEHRDWVACVHCGVEVDELCEVCPVCGQKRASYLGLRTDDNTPPRQGVAFAIRKGDLEPAHPVLLVKVVE